MIILSIDSSSKVATIALLEDNNLIGEYVLNNKKEHSTILMPMLQQLLTDTNKSIDDIDGFVISKGPGSFTGLRIGMATIKGLAFGSNKPYISISTLEALAYSLSTFNGLICPIMDALRENVYTSIYNNLDYKFEEVISPTSIDIDELVSLIKKENKDVIFVGDGVEKHKEYILNNTPNAKFAPTHLNIIRASSLGELGLNLIKNNIVDNPNSAPVYLKKPQAERELERRLQMNECKA